MRNPREIKKVVEAIEPLVGTPKRKAQITAFKRFYVARRHFFRKYSPKPRLRKVQAGQAAGP